MVERENRDRYDREEETMSYADVLPDPTESRGDYSAPRGPRHTASAAARYDIEQARLQGEFEAEFRRLAREWSTAVHDVSSVHDMVSHPSYLQIIGKGPRVVSYIIREMERVPNHWFVALESILGGNPVRPDQRGNVFEMKEAWIDWAEREGYA